MLATMGFPRELTNDFVVVKAGKLLSIRKTTSYRIVFLIKMSPQFKWHFECLLLAWLNKFVIKTFPVRC